MVDKVLKLLLLISPLAYATGMRLEKFEIVFFHIGVMALFIASMFDVPKRIRFFPVSLVSIFALCLASVAVHSFQPLSLGVLLNVFIFFIGLDIVCRYMGEAKQFHKYIAWAALINCFIWLMQRYWINALPFSIDYSDMAGSVFGSAPRLFNYLGVVMPILYSVTPLFLIIPVLAVIGNQFAPIVSTVISIFSSVKSNKSKLFILCLALIFGVLFHSHILAAFNVRFKDIFPQVVIGIGQVPLLGHGLGAYYNTFGADSFNILLLLGYDLGVLGMCALVYAIYDLRQYFRLNIETASLVSALVISMFDYVIEIPRLWFTLIFIVSSFLTQKREVVKC